MDRPHLLGCKNAMKRILFLLLVLCFAAVLLVPAGMAASADAVQDDFSTEEAAGCFSMSTGLFLKFLLLLIVISPIIADYFFLRALFQLSGIKCILLALLFTLMRLAAAVALYYLLRIPFCVVLYLAVGLPLYLLYLVFELIRLKKPDSPFEFLALSDESLGDLLAITSGLLAVFLLFTVYVPDILVFVAK